ncbi:hypothetical protein GA0115246_103548 [Streptomyces sp. SolWspMP-sol7th]|nr:hypothetical protein GA0115246_103548 [Streptomyces sp. SolWspMP-sol7th]
MGKACGDEGRARDGKREKGAGVGEFGYFPRDADIGAVTGDG